MYKAFLLYSIIFCLYFHAVHAQTENNGQLFIKNYSGKDLNASFSNWRINQDARGIIHAGNFEGVLEFDGSWKLLTDSLNFIGSLEITKSNNLFIGTNGNFGFLSASKKGRTLFNSLTNILPANKRGFNQTVWSIARTDFSTFFYTKEGIYQWDGADVKLWFSEANKYNSKLINIGNQVYCAQQGIGLVAFTKSGKQIVIKDSIHFNETLIALDSLNDDLLIATTSQGLLKYDGNKVTVIEGAPSELAKKYRLFDFKTLNISDNIMYAISTHQGGVFLLNKNFEITKEINNQSGLISNVIKQAYKDNAHNLWIAAIGGISMIETSSPWRFLDDKNGLEGSIWDITHYNNTLYVGTSDGLFMLDSGAFVKTPQITDKVWSIKKYTRQDGQQVLLVLTERRSNGLYEVLGNKIRPIGFGGGSALEVLADQSIIQDHDGHGIVQLKEKGGEYKVDPIVDRADINTSEIIEDDSGNLWIAVKSLGVFRVSNWQAKQKAIRLFDQIGSKEQLDLEYINKTIYVSSYDGIYKFDSKNGRFIKQDELNGKYTTLSIFNDSTLIAGTYTPSHKSSLQLLEVQKDGNLIKKDSRQFARPNFEDIINIKQGGDSILWVAAANGLFKFDKSINKNIDFKFNTLIRNVSVNDSTVFYGNYSISDSLGISRMVQDQPEDYKFTFEPNQDNFTFQFTCTSYEAFERNQYSFYLKNNDEDWSKWTTESKKEYTNLSSGEYTFMVKSKNIYDNEGQIATYNFTILPPWHQTAWAYLLFAILIALGVWFIVLAYSYRVRMQRQRLKLIVADRTFEVLRQKKEIESQNELLQEQYDEISIQRDEIRATNIELEQSQEEILTINERLKELNHSLEMKVEERTSRIKATLIQLQKANKELDTFVYRASHDLKGPISRIHGLTSIAKLEATEEAALKYYDLIEHAALDMQGLLSKLSHAYEIMNKEVLKEKVDIPVMLSEIRNRVKFLDVGTKYTFDISQKLTFNTDKYLLHIILENLTENALVFRKKMSKVDHEVKVKCFEEGSYFIFEIVDNGIGINQDHYVSIYEMFFRGSDQSKGSGLGLYLVKLALDKLNGTINVTSTLHHYSQFTVSIPKG